MLRYLEKAVYPRRPTTPEATKRVHRRLDAERAAHTKWTKMEKGGHFAALEQPELLAREIRELFRPLR